MRNIHSLIFCIALLCCAGLNNGTSTAFAQSNAAPPKDAESATVLTEGKRLEYERRWQEAIQFYEKTIKKNPRFRECNERLQICRVHFDVTRRYSDRSFLQTVDQSTPAEAFEVMSEVLAKLDVYYVEAIDYYKLALHGTAFLEVALTEQDFLSKHLPNANAEAVENFRRNIHKSVFGKRIQNQEELRATVASVAHQASQQINLAPTAVIYEYIAGSVGLLDPYSALLTVGEYREVMSQIEGNLIGLGVELWAEGTELRIVDVFRGGPANQAGLLPNQHILEVDGMSVNQIGAKKAADLLRGTEGSYVRLVLRSTHHSKFSVDIQRKRVDVPSVSIAEMAEPDIGYVRITNFQKTTPSEVARAMATLRRQGMKSIIIDVRRNPGGLLDASVELADQFLSRGSIVSTHGRNGQENHNFTATDTKWECELPLVVLIDGDSASASEIFAGAIRDHNRGYVVGQTSYGKGSVQGVFHNEHGNGGLRLTVSKFFSPKGTAISARGIEPHVVVPEPSAAASTLDQTVFRQSVPTSDGQRYVAKVESNPGNASTSVVEPVRDAAKERAIEIARKQIGRG